VSNPDRDNEGREPPQWSVAPLLIVKDVLASANFYRDRLGFAYDRLWNDPPSFCMVRRGGIVIMLLQLSGPGVPRPNRLSDPNGEAWDIYVWVDDVEALHAEFMSRGVRIVRGLCDQPYDNRDFEVEDCDGYRLCFGQPLPRHCERGRTVIELRIC
jgi:catechol 2,3-dioxygenase-like lactoylglutathione lyase family enzyme